MASPIGEERGSVGRNLGLLSEEQQGTYHRNMRAFHEDRRQLEQWASNGFVSGYEVISGDTLFAEAQETGRFRDAA